MAAEMFSWHEPPSLAACQQRGNNGHCHRFAQPAQHSGQRGRPLLVHVQGVPRLGGPDQQLG
eukprot:8524217-Alexandrium_andersonii.AAC.1